MGFWISLICNVLTGALFLGWARRETDARIGKMQDAAFDTPGAQSPLPASVLVAGGALLVGEWSLAQGACRLSSGRTLATLFLGVLLAGAVHFLQSPDNRY